MTEAGAFRLKALGLGVLSALVLLPGLGRMPSLINSMEYAYSVAVPLEMIEKGRFLTPILEGETYLLKPPLLWWMIMAAYKAFGVSLLAMRLPSAFFAGATVAASAFLGRLFGLSSSRALAASGLTFASIGFFGTSRIAYIDLPLTFLMVVAFHGLSRFLLRSEPRGLLLCGAAGGAAAMLKWPVPAAVLLPFLAFWYAGSGRRDTWSLFARHVPVALAAALLIGLPWNLLMAWRFGEGYWNHVFVQELFRARLIASENVPLGTFAGMVLAALLPWTPVVLATLLSPRPWAAWRASREDRLIALWAVASFLPFLVQKIKTERYVLFLIPALMIWTLRRFDPARPLHKFAARAAGTGVLLAGAVVAGAGAWLGLGAASALLALSGGLVSARALRNGDRFGAAAAGFAAILLAGLGLMLPRLGSSLEPARTALQSASGPVAIACPLHEAAYLPLVAGRNLWNLYTERNFPHPGETTSWRLALSKGFSLVVSGRERDRLEAFLEAFDGAACRADGEWTWRVFSRASRAEAAAALKRRGFSAFEDRFHVLSGFRDPKGFAPRGRPIEQPERWFPLDRGGFLVSLTVRCPAGLETAGGFKGLGYANLVDGEGKIWTGGGISKRDLLRSNPFVFVWPVRVEAGGRFRISFGTYPGEPALEIVSLCIQKLPEGLLNRIIGTRN